jgi:methylated-DNA-[protein]-cysteine S-methyltransferase
MHGRATREEQAVMVGRTEGGHPLPPGSAWGEIDTPIGPLALVVTPAGLIRLNFGPLRRIARDFDPLKPPADLAEHEAGAAAIRQLTEYFAGVRQSFDIVVDWSLTAGAQRAVLETLHAKVPYGSTVGYGGLALMSGRTLGASRLVGTVMGSNPVAIVVPCHRVIAADGGIGGFGGGLETKRRLLTLEGALPPTLFDL